MELNILPDLSDLSDHRITHCHCSNLFLSLSLSFLSAAREAELRRLRKANVEFEEQNAVLQKHIANMYSAKERLEAELGQDEQRTQSLQRHLLALKQTLVSSLSGVPLPGLEAPPGSSLSSLSCHLLA